MLRRPAPREVRERSDHRESQVTRHRHGDHIFVNHLAELDAGVVTVRDDVDRRVAHDEVELHVRVIAEKAREERFTDHRLGDRRRVQPQRTARCVAKFADGGHGGAHFVERWTQ